MTRRRVVVTGLGAVTALGLDAPATFAGLLQKRSGVGPITHFDAKDHATTFAAEVRGFDPATVLEPHEARKLDPFALFAMAAAKEALADSGLDLAREDLARIGCVIGVGIGGLTDLEAQHSTLLERGPRRVNPFFIPRIMMNAAAGQISIRFGLQGPNFATASACASSSHAVGLAAQAIRLGEADAMLAGGSEATITPLGVAGFNALKALSTRNDAPARASRPFDRDRDGFVMGEGGGALVLEELERARARGARIYAEVKGFAMTADAFHITAPDPAGRSAARAMRRALEHAGLQPEDVDYLCAHATSTPVGDVAEVRAIRQAFGGHAERLAISSPKSMVGHLLGAAGALSALVAVKAIHEGVIPPTINLDRQDPECDLDFVPNVSRRVRVQAALANGFGFGGQNVVAAFTQA